MPEETKEPDRQHDAPALAPPDPAGEKGWAKKGATRRTKPVSTAPDDDPSADIPCTD